VSGFGKHNTHLGKNGLLVSTSTVRANSSTFTSPSLSLSARLYISMHRWAVRLLHPRCCGELGGCVRRGMGNGRVSVSFRTFQWQQRTERANVNNDDMRQDKTYRKRAARFLQLPVVPLPRRTVRVSHEPTGAETRAHPACGERVLTPAGCWPPKCGPMSKNYRSEKEEPLFFSLSESLRQIRSHPLSVSCPCGRETAISR
jgi:hypothetical protein